MKVSSGSGGSTYEYNGDGLRVKKTTASGTTAYLYEYDKVVLETDGAGKQTARNTYGINLITRTAGTDKFFYLYNGHADVTALINTVGTIVGTYEYDAFGNITNKTGTSNNSIRYAGYQYDEENKLYYLNARYYDPKIARFLSEDTYRGQADDPLSLNLYSYVHNEPMMYVDPTGNTDVSLREIAGATGSTIVYDAKTKTATVTLVSGYSVTFDPKQKGSGVTLVNGRMIVDNEVFDKMMTGSKKTSSGTIYAYVDSYVAPSVKDKKGNEIEAAKVAVVTLVGKQTNSYVKNDFGFAVPEMKTLRNSTVIYNKDTNKVLDTTSVFSLPSFLSPQALGGENSNSLAYSALVGYAFKDGEMNKGERKQLDFSKDGAALLELSIRLNKQGMSLAQASFLYQQQYGNFDLVAAYAGIRSIKVGGSVSAPVKVVNRSSFTSNRRSSNTSQGAGNSAKLSSSTNPNDYLNTALKRQGLDKAPSNFKEKWSQDGYDYEVRIHPADPKYGKQGDIYRVARREQGTDANGQGKGWEYMDSNGNWHSTSSLKPQNPSYNAQAAADTHIQLK
ncbi:RHS repeat-associated core domain-containing protein [Cohnella faecalis]|uniref:RHS repeat-associated core domain-containing protein n=1 Tax=Cohnella faecalis TaxID=2315694 RepID=UPI00131432BC|nr:RHS repeat-associated core domain-containing protein [Cohnella faecalis]